ncbi:MAG: hypothetical protein DI526_22675 [Caulobacter segnis]|uniref:Uncharacterized protein n=1 Tax=Caulobacter segnis TaxID=88688 RepID=A0A2W5UTM7_9CAUL|nr:MAG: hypothetical protein DI526_22675 [Caulobacter segnis]
MSTIAQGASESRRTHALVLTACVLVLVGEFAPRVARGAYHRIHDMTTAAPGRVVSAGSVSEGRVSAVGPEQAPR